MSERETKIIENAILSEFFERFTLNNDFWDKRTIKSAVKYLFSDLNSSQQNDIIDKYFDDSISVFFNDFKNII